MMALDFLSLVQNPTLTVLWKVSKIVLVRYIYTGPIYSESIPIYNQGISLWRFVLLSVENYLEFYILRYPSDDDENDPIIIQFQISLVNHKDEIYFEDTSDVLTYSKPSADPEGRSFANESNLKSKIRIPKRLFKINIHPLNLRCNIKLSTVGSETDDCTSDYQSLHSDLLCMLRDEDVYDLFLHSGGVDYGFNSFLVKVRLPCFDALVSTYEDILKYDGNAEERDKCPVFERFTMMHRRPARHFYADTLAQAIFRLFYKTPSVLFIKRVLFTVETLQRSFTLGVCEALQSYLHLGSATVHDQRDVEGLSNLARGLHLHDLVHRLEGRPREFRVFTDFLGVEWNYCLTSEHFRDWEKRKFEPIVKRCDLRVFQYSRKMIVTFLIVQPDDVLSIEIRFPASDMFPIVLVCELTLKSLTGDVLRRSISSHFYRKDKPWCPKGVDLKKEDFSSKELFCRFFGYYYCSNKPACSDYFRFGWHRGDVNVWNVRRLSSELSRSLGNDSTTDVVLVAKGRKLEAHIIILSARSKRFQEELRKKRFLGHKTIHLVPGIEYTTLVELIKYLYTGETDLENSDSVFKLLSAAEKFGVPSLVRICQYFLEHKAQLFF